MLPGSRESWPVSISSIPSSQLQQCSGCCGCLDKICKKFLSTSSNSNIGCQSDVGQYSNESAFQKDSTGYDNQWRDRGGRFFACTGTLCVAADCSSKVTTILDPSGRRNEEQVCFEYEGKQSGLCAGACGSSGICQMDATIPAAGSFLIGAQGDFACGNDANRSLLQCQGNFLGLSFTGKTCRSSTDHSGSPRKVQAGSLKSYETMRSCPTEYFVSSPTFRTLNLPENTCSRSFLKDFKIWDKTSTCCLSEQKLFVSNDKNSPATKQLIHFDSQSLCMSILEQADSNPAVALICSKLARHGYLSRGRGAVALLFKTSEKANQFIVPDFRVTSLSYVVLNDSPVNSEWPGKDQSKFAHLCQLYNPECQYIFSVTVDACEEVCCNALSIQEEDLISQMNDDLVSRFCAKLPLYILRSINLSLDIDEPGATLILTPVPGSGLSENGDERRAREICFINIQQKLRQRGVSLRHQFPEIYRQLCAYTEKNVDFVPVSLFLFDSKTRKKFLCLIMPNSEPFCAWMEELFGELGPETVV